jgi:hypothetical protein
VKACGTSNAALVFQTRTREVNFPSGHFAAGPITRLGVRRIGARVWGRTVVEVPVDPNQPKRRRKSRKSLDADVGDAVADSGGELARGVSDFTQLALYMAASLAGMVTALLVARRPFFESLLRRVGGAPSSPGRRVKRVASRARGQRRELPPTPEESLPLLAEAIIGNTKAAVASVFGPPRSAALRGVVKADAAKTPGYWQATTWYYPLPRNDLLAMAIEFDQDNARRVEFFRAPGGPTSPRS